MCGIISLVLLLFAICSLKFLKLLSVLLLVFWPHPAPHYLAPLDPLCPYELTQSGSCHGEGTHYIFLCVLLWYQLKLYLSFQDNICDVFSPLTISPSPPGHSETSKVFLSSPDSFHLVNTLPVLLFLYNCVHTFSSTLLPGIPRAGSPPPLLPARLTH